MKSIYARKQVELFLDEEVRSIQEEYEPGENKLRVIGTTHLHKENEVWTLA